jgi:methylated-DNA-protein-cysteine methyltransferase-like protein
MYSPPDPATFNALVWDIVKQIPAGQVSTYGQIASMIPPPTGVDPPQYDRLGPIWVGNAMRATPAEQGIPWHRVIGGKGTISLPEASQTAREQRARLEREGVVFDGRGRVDFKAVGWEGPDPSWLQERGLLPPRPLRRSPTQPSLL